MLLSCSTAELFLALPRSTCIGHLQDPMHIVSSFCIFRITRMRFPVQTGCIHLHRLRNPLRKQYSYFQIPTVPESTPRLLYSSRNPQDPCHWAFALQRANIHRMAVCLWERMALTYSSPLHPALDSPQSFPVFDNASPGYSPSSWKVSAGT